MAADRAASPPRLVSGPIPGVGKPRLSEAFRSGSLPANQHLVKTIIAAGLLLFLLGVSPLLAGAPQTVELTAYPFQKSVLEVQLGAGAFFSIGDRQTMNYASESLRFGWMFSDIHGGGLLRGNWEGLLELFSGEVFVGPGNFFAGGSLIGRYNFVQEQARFVPYFQLGAGALGDNIYRNKNQRLVGSGFEFLLRTGLGFRWSINRNWAFFTEGEYQHISNADTASRNIGLNALGVTVGVSRFF